VGFETLVLLLQLACQHHGWKYTVRRTARHAAWCLGRVLLSVTVLGVLCRCGVGVPLPSHGGVGAPPCGCSCAVSGRHSASLSSTPVVTPRRSSRQRCPRPSTERRSVDGSTPMDCSPRASLSGCGVVSCGIVQRLY
jgi:hypothetical protein